MNWLISGAGIIYLFNLVQSFAEILFFFNPGVLWIGSLIREERENCCDDIAVQATGSKKGFVHALVSFQENNRSIGRFAIAFPGAGNHLLQRVKRILYRDDKVLDGREKLFLLCSCLVTAGLVLAFSSAPPANGATMKYGATRRILMDTVLPPAVKPAPVDPDKSVAAEMPIAAVRRDTLIIPRIKAPMPAIDAPPVPPAKAYSKDTAGVGKMGMDKAEEQEWKAKLDEWQAKEAEWQAKQIEWQITQEKWNKHLQEMQQEVAKNNAASGEGNIKEQEAALEEQRRVLSEAERELNAQMKSIVMAEGKLEQEKRMLIIEQMPGSPPPPDALMKLKQIQIVPDLRMKLNQIQIVPDAKPNFITPIVNDLIADKLIDDPEIFSFELSKEGLIVNGVRQPDEIFQRYKEKYIKDPRTQLIYSRRKDGSESSTINVFN